MTHVDYMASKTTRSLHVNINFNVLDFLSTLLFQRHLSKKLLHSKSVGEKAAILLLVSLLLIPFDTFVFCFIVLKIVKISFLFIQ